MFYYFMFKHLFTYVIIMNYLIMLNQREYM